MPTSNVNDRFVPHFYASFHAVFGRWRWIGFLSLLALFVGFIAPFGTHEAWNAATRHLYWALIVFATAATGHATTTTLDHLIAKTRWPKLVRIPFVASLTALSVCATLLLIWCAIGFPVSAEAALDLLFDCLVVVCSVMAFSSLLSPAQTKSPEDTKASRLITRLPGGKRGRLIRVSAQDHYVQVVTDEGSTLLSMRFCDAMAETAPEPGAQIHRSHWVAERAILDRVRRGHGTGFKLKDGSFVPIGRSFKAALRTRNLHL